MKFTAKILSLVTIFFSIIAMTFVASAATKEDIINKLESSKVSANYIALAQDYLKSNNFTSTQYDAAFVNVGKVVDIMNTENVTDPLKLSATAKTAALKIVNDTASQTGITATVGVDSKGVSFIKLSGTGKNIFEVSASDLALKVTGGNNYASLLMLTIGLVLIAFGATFIIKRKLAVNA